jgi:hypothetical protein
MSKHIADGGTIQEFGRLLEDAPRKGPGAVVGVVSAFLADEEIAYLTNAAPATVRGWRTDPEKRIRREAADRLDVVRVIAIWLLRASPSAWTKAGLGAWFRSRNFDLLNDAGMPMTPLEALKRWDEQDVMLALMTEPEGALSPH